MRVEKGGGRDAHKVRRGDVESEGSEMMHSNGGEGRERSE